MEFEVTRTSSRSNVQPCKGAVQKDCIRTDVRTFKSPEDFQKRLNQDWFADGDNHRKLKGGGIARDLPTKAWFIEVNSLDDLMQMYHKLGDLVIRESWRRTGEACIEIYDDYRE